VLGEEHPETLVSMSGVAVVYQAQGKYAQAEALESKVLEVQRRVLGEEHLYTLNTMNHLASMYAEQGQIEQAQALYVKTLAIQRRVLGEEHPETLITMVGLGNVYRIQGQYQQAEQLYTKSLEIQSRVLGEDYRDTRGTMSNLAELDRLERKFDQAEQLDIKVLGIRRRLVGEKHPDTLASMNRLAAVYVEEGKYALGEALAREALTGYEETKSDVWERYNSQSLAGASLAKQRRYAEAEPLLVAGYEGMEQRKATIPAAYWSSLDRAGASLVQFYLDGGKTDKAAEWQQMRRALSTKVGVRRQESGDRSQRQVGVHSGILGVISR
jgi:eukaryotic-like serine/threonine-protein kinase